MPIYTRSSAFSTSRAMVLGEGVLLAVLLQHHGGGDLIDPGGIEGDIIAQVQGAAGGERCSRVGGGGRCTWLPHGCRSGT